MGEQASRRLRLDKILTLTGRWSRREAGELVRAGRVTVNGKVPKKPEERFAPEGLIVLVDGAPIQAERFRYLMLYKPGGVLSASRDRTQKTVLDLLPDALWKADLFPVGRLDKDAEGLLLLTNDGPLAHGLLSPRRHVEKVYFVRTQTALQKEDCAAFAGGMELRDGLCCMHAKLELLPGEGPCCALVTLREGKYHQIKRMLAARGKPVVYLKRLSMGPIILDPTLKPGEYRPLTQEERQFLQAIKDNIPLADGPNCENFFSFHNLQRYFGVFHKKM